MKSQEKIKILNNQGMDTNNLDFTQLEFVYDVVINNKEVELKKEKKQYEKINWAGEKQLKILLNIIEKFNVCLSIKKNNNTSTFNIFSYLEFNNRIHIDSKPKIILKKIKKRCDFIVTSNKWLKKSQPFSKISKNNFRWNDSIESEESILEIQKLCSLVLNDNVSLKRELNNGIF